MPGRILWTIYVGGMGYMLTHIAKIRAISNRYVYLRLILPLVLAGSVLYLYYLIPVLSWVYVPKPLGEFLWITKEITWALAVMIPVVGIAGMRFCEAIEGAAEAGDGGADGEVLAVEKASV